MKIIITILCVACAMILLCVGVILRKDGQFRSQHISENARMREKHIHCATAQDREAKRMAQRKLNVKEL